MNWNWRYYVRKNFYKIIAHQLLEYSVIGGVWIAFEGDPIFWPIGIALGTLVHVVVFTKIDFLHEWHHHHNGKKRGHADHKDLNDDSTN